MKQKILYDELSKIKIDRDSYIKKHKIRNIICYIIESLSCISILSILFFNIELELLNNLIIIFSIPGIISAFYKNIIDTKFGENILEYDKDIKIKELEIKDLKNKKELKIENNNEYDYCLLDTDINQLNEIKNNNKVLKKRK